MRHGDDRAGLSGRRMGGLLVALPVTLFISCRMKRRIAGH
jgi:hypothetical protein